MTRFAASLGTCLAVAALVSGCSLGGGDDNGSSGSAASTSTAPRSTPPASGVRPRPGEPPEAAAIRGWSRDISAGRFDRAARFFVPHGAIVIQGTPVRLPDRAAVVAFNRSLPCKSRVSDVQRQGRYVVATFVLRKGSGPAQACDQPVRVRFTFRGGRFQVFRQLQDQAAPPGDVT